MRQDVVSRFLETGATHGGRAAHAPVSADVAAIDLSLNNYLGLRDHPGVERAAIAAIERYGVGAASGRNAADRIDLHEELERKIAAFKGVEAALTFQSGFATNIGLIPALVGRSDVVIYDELSHASTVDAIRLSGAAAIAYPHRNVDQLEQKLRELRSGRSNGRPRNVVIATDGVFGMDGDIAPLPEICSLAERFEALVIVDDAHATGVLGANGRGSAEHFGLGGRVHVQVGTLSKAIGCFGGFVAADDRVCGHLLRRARPVLYSTLLPPSLAAAALAAIEVIEREPERRERLWANTRRFRDRLRRAGFETGTSETPIVPVLLGSGDAARRFSDRLRQEGIVVQPVADSPIRRARVRTIVNAQHTDEQLDRAATVMTRVGRELAALS